MGWVEGMRSCLDLARVSFFLHLRTTRAFCTAAGLNGFFIRELNSEQAMWQHIVWELFCELTLLTENVVLCPTSLLRGLLCDAVGSVDVGVTGEL